MSEFWHAKALDVAISFLPSECPLVTHILTSYQKHHAPVQQEIPEDQEPQNHGLKVIRPLTGIDIAKFQPIVRQDPSLQIRIAALEGYSPTNYQPLVYKKELLRQAQLQKQQELKNSINHKTGETTSSIGGQGNTTIESKGQIDRFNKKQPPAKREQTINQQQQSQAKRVQDILDKANQELTPPQPLIEGVYEVEVESEDAIHEDIGDSVLTEKQPQHKSMMELMPSSQSKYQRLLQNDIEKRKVHNLNEDSGNDTEQEDEELGDQMYHYTTQEDQSKQNGENGGDAIESGKKSRKPGTSKASDQNERAIMREQLQKLIKDYGDEIASDSQSAEYGDELESQLMIGGSIDRRTKNYNIANNLSLDEGQRVIKRPQTSQGVRGSGTSKSSKGPSLQQTNKVPLKKGVANHQHISQDHSAERASPHGTAQRVSSGRLQNQSMVTSGGQHNTSGKVLKGRQIAQGITPNKQPHIINVAQNNKGGVNHVAQVIGQLLSGNNHPQQQSRQQFDRSEILRTEHSSQSEAAQTSQIHQKRSSSSRSAAKHRTVTQSNKQKILDVPQTEGATQIGINGESKRASNTLTAMSNYQTNPQLSHQQLIQRSTFNTQSAHQLTVNYMPAQPSSGQKQKKTRREFMVAVTPTPGDLKTNAIGHTQSQQILGGLSGQRDSSNESKSRRFMAQEQLDLLMRKKVDLLNPTGLLDDNSLTQKPRAKSRSKVQSSRSKEKFKLRQSEHTNGVAMGQQQMEEFKRQIFTQGQQRRKTPQGGAGSMQQVPQKKTLETQQQWLQNQMMVMSSQNQNSSQQWIQVPAGGSVTINAQSQNLIFPGTMIPISQQQQNAGLQPLPNVPGQQQIKLNTHQLIKRFLDNRQQQSIGGNSGAMQVLPMQYNQPQPEIGYGQEQIASNYKQQLSKKILQQQQKLMSGGILGGGQQIQQVVHGNGKKVKAQYMTEPHPGAIKRSSTPMIEMHDFAKPLAPPPSAQQVPATTVGVPSLKLAQVPALEGKATPEPSIVKQHHHQSQQLLKDYQTAAAHLFNSESGTAINSSQSQREDSMILLKSAKKKLQQKVGANANGIGISGGNLQTGTQNVPSNSQLAWQ
ncbi:hypothetical protein FGO68_gene1369 [Halteria grandinella]|uniref:Uncharacterized protein n=1 Tax=Halteria grandinella TaxID=5974 RepID=A0A8J8P4A9_HALGN|nr:hypothetical protein FGO68_gene1369 [Halteria grandinella]